jgi:hypothetical protein
VLVALGIRPLDSKRYVDLLTPERARLLDDLLAARGLSLDALCNGLVDGRIGVISFCSGSHPAPNITLSGGNVGKAVIENAHKARGCTSVESDDRARATSYREQDVGSLPGAKVTVVGPVAGCE